MKFYSKITKKPVSVIEEIKDGLKIVKQTRICVFIKGVCETDDPKVIEKLKAHPNKYRTDRPWKLPEDLGTKVKYELLKYKELLIEAEKAGIKSKKKKEIIEALNKKGSDK